MKKNLKVIYAGIRAENYNPKRKDSFEYTNFWKTLHYNIDGKNENCPYVVKAQEYAFDDILQVGKREWNRRLLELVRKEKSDILFVFMYSDELEEATLDEIKNSTDTITIGWFADDYWRFFNYSRHWASHFSYVVTTYYKAAEWYRAAGHQNVILSQWGCNTGLYKPPKDINTSFMDGEQDTDVSFIGQKKPARAHVIKQLQKKGIQVKTFGFGWGPEGRVPHEKLLHSIARSKINLNLNVRDGLLSPAVIGRLFLKRARNRLAPDFHLIDNFRAYLHFPTLHTHARPFELAGAGGFVISGYSDGIERYYEPDREMVFYRTTEELAEKIRYYLAHDDERKRIREAGYKRTLRDHTYVKRFEALFDQVALPLPKPPRTPL